MKKYANKTVLAAEKLLEKDPTCCYNAAADREQNYLGKKIAQARAEAGLSLNGVRQLLAVRGIRVGVPAINKWEQGETVPNAYQLMALAELLGVEDDLTYFMSSSPRAQLNREGLRKVAAYRDDLIASGRYRPQEHTIAFREMPVSYLSASAGTGQFLDEGNFELLSFPVSYIPEGAEFGIRVSGDSMEPMYHDGQIVWVRRCDSLEVGQVGIFVYDGEGYIKAYDEQEPEDMTAYLDSYGVIHRQPVLVSFNRKYEPKVVSPLADFQIVGRVL